MSKFVQGHFWSKTHFFKEVVQESTNMRAIWRTPPFTSAAWAPGSKTIGWQCLWGEWAEKRKNTTCQDPLSNWILITESSRLQLLLAFRGMWRTSAYVCISKWRHWWPTHLCVCTYIKVEVDDVVALGRRVRNFRVHIIIADICGACLRQTGARHQRMGTDE